MSPFPWRLFGLALSIIFLGTYSAQGQRIQFSSPLTAQVPANNPGATPGTLPTAPGSPYNAPPATYAAPPGGYTQPSTPGAPYATPGQPVYANPGVTASPPAGTGTSGTAPAWVAPGTSSPSYSTPTAPGGVSPFVPPSGPPPGATFGGTIQPPAAGWDPYGAAGSGSPSLMPQDPYFQSGVPLTGTPITKFIQEVRLDYHWFLGHGENELGINDAQLDVTAAFPMFFNSTTPLRVTPGFATHWWDGPISVSQNGRPVADLPPRTYDTYIMAAWDPEITQWLRGELMFQTGLFTDFTAKISSQDLRYRGSGVAALKFSPHLEVKAGVMYLDRIRVKLLPTGGFVWTPNQDIEIAALFPNPRIRRRLMNYGSVEWWVYAMGDYGGGDWSIVRADLPQIDPAVRGQRDKFDYNDIRMAVGLDFKTPRNFNGFFEAGVAVERELRYASDLPNVYYARPTVYLHGGVAY